MYFVFIIYCWLICKFLIGVYVIWVVIVGICLFVLVIYVCIFLLVISSFIFIGVWCICGRGFC